MYMIKYFKNIGKVLVASIFLLGCGACNNVEDEKNDSENTVDLVTWDTCGYQQGEHMCDFTLKDKNGSDFSLYDHIGRPIVLDFSTMWCGYCQVAARDVEAIANKYSEQDLLYVTVLIEDQIGNPAEVEDCDSWSSIFGIIDQPVLAGSREMLQSSESDGVPISGWPTFYFLTEDMVIDTILKGYSAEAIEFGIQGLINTQE